MILSPPFAAKALRAGISARPIRERAIVLAMLQLLFAASAASAATYYVDAANPNATDAGSGSSSTPYRTIQAAVTARGTAGNTILVRPATYRETVTISQSGSSSSRIVLQASPTGAILSGSDDFSSTSKWTSVGGNVYLAATATWTPGQVFLDGARLASSANPPASIPSRSYLDVEVNDYPIASSETFQVDDITIERVTGAAAARLQTLEPPTVFEVRLAPNPVRSEAVLSFATTRPGAARVEIFDVAGRLVGVPADEPWLPAGRQSVSFSLRGTGTVLQPGTYFYQLRAEEGTRGGKFVLVR